MKNHTIEWPIPITRFLVFSVQPPCFPMASVPTFGKSPRQPSTASTSDRQARNSEPRSPRARSSKFCCSSHCTPTVSCAGAGLGMDCDDGDDDADVGFKCKDEADGLKKAGSGSGNGMASSLLPWLERSRAHTNMRGGNFNTVPSIPSDDFSVDTNSLSSACVAVGCS